MIEFRGDCEQAMNSFDTSRPAATPGPETRELIRQLREKWDAAAEPRRMTGAGLYADLYEAIVRLPHLTHPDKWFDDLYNTRTTAPFIEDRD